MKLRLHILAIWFIFSSCSQHEKYIDLRAPSSNESCNNLIAKIISHNNTDAEKIRLQKFNLLKTKGILDDDFIQNFPKMSEKIFLAHEDISNKTSRFPQLAGRFYEHPAFNGRFITYPKDPEILLALKNSFNKLNDSKEFADYIARLMRDMAEAMKKENIKDLNIGILTDPILLERILIQRALDAGEEVSTLKGNSATGFREILRKGPFIDLGVDEPHGAYSHLIQLDFTREVMLQATSGNRSKVFLYLSGYEGNMLWDRIFDNLKNYTDPTVWSKPEVVALSPESLTIILKPHLPLK